MAKGTRFILTFIAVIVGATSVASQSFDSAKTFPDCIQALINTQTGLSCEYAREYTKCSIRTLGLVDLLSTPEAIQNFEDGLHRGFAKAGLSCDVDVASVEAELKAEQGRGVATKSGIYYGVMAVVTMIAMLLFNYF